MILSDWIARLQAADIFYVPLAVGRFEDLVVDLVIADEDLTDAVLDAEVRAGPDESSGAPLAIMSATLSSVATQTWDDLVSAGDLASVPPGETGTTAIKVSTVRLSLAASAVSSLPFSSVVVGGGVTLFWDLRITTVSGDVFTAAAGDFKIAQGVSR